MDRKELVSLIEQKQSFLCVGLDTDIARLPEAVRSEPNPVVAFNQRIIEATHEVTLAYKINTAFYESRGRQGWQDLEETVQLIPEGCFVIADAKRGDIGNTSRMYAEAFLKQLSFDAVTVAPYMGHDSVTPFLEVGEKWVILLALTSNPGALDFQMFTSPDGQPLFERVVEVSQTWPGSDRLMYVVGATRGQDIERMRTAAPEAFFLVPGVGAQGGSLEEVARYGMNRDCGLLVNSSRGILYASSGEDYAQAARAEAKRLQQEMRQLLDSYRL